MTQLSLILFTLTYPPFKKIFILSWLPAAHRSGLSVQVGGPLFGCEFSFCVLTLLSHPSSPPAQFCHLYYSLSVRKQLCSAKNHLHVLDSGLSEGRGTVGKEVCMRSVTNYTTCTQHQLWGSLQCSSPASYHGLVGSESG